MIATYLKINTPNVVGSDELTREISRGERELAWTLTGIKKKKEVEKL